MKPKQRSVKKYSLPVHCSDEFADVPTKARFSITRSKAREIVRLSKLVKDNYLYCVELFDGSVNWISNNPQFRAECHVITITNDDFRFSAYLKFTGIAFESEHGSIASLVKYFGL